MKYSIHTRLTLLIALVYASVFFFLITAAALAVYIGIKVDIDKKLQTERDGMTELFESEFTDLLTALGSQRTRLTDEFLEKLKEIHGYKNQFVIFSLDTEAGRRVYSDGGIKNVQLFLPKGFLSKEADFYNQRLVRKLYRVLISKSDWGTLAVGIENQAYFEIADRFKGILFVGVPLTLILVLVGGYFLAGRAMRPVAAAAETAEKITLTNLSARLPEYTGKDEFGKLVTTLNRMIGRLEQGVKQVQQFTQDAAHELRTPLTTLRGELELAYQKQNLPGEVQSALQKSLDRAISMGQIVDNLMLLAQSGTGNYPIQKSSFQLDELVRDLVDDVKSLADGRLIEVRLAHCDKVEFTGDKQLMQRLLLNLSDNALKNTEQGFIEFNLQNTDRNIELVIRDTGKGIPEDELPHVFERFYRVDKVRSRATGGTGLGLAICEWIVDLHDGKISLASKIFKGTTVKILLPTSIKS